MFVFRNAQAGKKLRLCFQPFKLHVVIFCIDPIFCEKRFVIPALLNPIVVQDEDFIRVSDRGKAMGNDHGGAVFGEPFQALLDMLFTFIVQGLSLIHI